MSLPAPPAPPARILVTGADGTIGRATVDGLLAAGFAVSALSLSWSGPTPADRVFTGNAADEPLVHSALADVEGIVHLAAIPHPRLGTPREVFVGNTSSTFTVLNAAGERGIGRAVVASSINAFGIPLNHHDVTPAYYPLDEHSPIALDDPYSLSKQVDELSAGWAHSRWGMTTIALRFPLVRALPEVRRFAASLAANPAETARLAREGWAYLDLADAVDAVLLALTAPVDGAHTLLLAARDTLVAEPTDELLDLYAPHSERRRPFPGRTSPVDTSAARDLLGWTPRHGLAAPDEPLDTTPQETRA